MPSSRSAGSPRFRSAVDGRFVTEQQAKAAPRETVKETRRAPTPPKGGKR